MAVHVGEGAFQGRLANLTLKFTAKLLPFCFGPRRRALGEYADNSPSHAVSVNRQAYWPPYDRAVHLMERLLRLPSIAGFLYPILVDEKIKSAYAFKVPTEPLRTLFERGYTLNIMLNEMESPFVPTIDLAEGDQTEMFWRGCLDAGLVTHEMLVDEERLELTLRTVSKILDVLEGRGKLGRVDPRYLSPRTIYPHTSEGRSRAAELARTEIAYVHDLERLVGVLSRSDPLYMPAQNLAVLHRELSMRIQYLAAQPTQQQMFDAVFDGLVDGFDAYLKFCAERVRGCASRGTVDVDSLLMRPVQRLAQYPLLFQSIVSALCDVCTALPASQHPVQAMASADAAMKRSKQILKRANEATREALNEKLRDDFYARVDIPPPDLGVLLTRTVVSARLLHEFSEVEAYLFDNRLVLCRALKMRPARPSRVRRTLSALHLAMLSPAKKPKRQSASSSSSATLHGDELEFRLPEIDTVTPPAGLLLSSHVSLATLRDPPRITFTSSPDVTIQEQDENPESDQEPSMDPLVVKISLNIDAISKVSQVSELGGTLRMAIQFMANDGTQDIAINFRRLSPEDAGLWLRLLRRTVPLTAVEETPARTFLVNHQLLQTAKSKHT
ncbi:Guanine nucleotide exchange factor for Cdc42p [Coemansia sp. RSA 2599]|nr:Guanine nucleotide exchange factor for Cdc42p [Coemansia sp. RSA 2599]